MTVNCACPGYVLTGIGEAALSVYFERYGPVNAARRYPPARETALKNIAARREAEEQAEQEAKDQAAASRQA